MDLNELNKEMFNLQNEFEKTKLNSPQFNVKTVSQPKHFPNQQDVNFQNVKKNIDTTQIKRPMKSGDHRNDINEKMNMLNTNYFHSEIKNPNSTDMLNNQSIMNFQSSRTNNTNYANTINNLQPAQSRNQQSQGGQGQQGQGQGHTNHFSNYYNNNFETLQSSSLPTSPTKNNQGKSTINYSSLDDMFQTQNQFQNTNEQNTHDTGVSMLNVRNMHTMNNSMNNSNPNSSQPNHTQPTMSNKINDTGYHRKEEMKTDYRQNMNTKLDDIIFNNPNATPINPILQQDNHYNGNGNFNSNNNFNGNNLQKDTRMVIQDSNKDFYRQSANDRMSQYSPLSRAANIPIHMANMSVNDFYSNMNPTPEGDFKAQQKIINEEHNRLNSKETLNNRMNNYAPLAKTIQYDTKQSNSGSGGSGNGNGSGRPKQWNPNDVNGTLKNVVYNQMPVLSNNEN